MALHVCGTAGTVASAHWEDFLAPRYLHSCLSLRLSLEGHRFAVVFHGLPAQDMGSLQTWHVRYQKWTEELSSELIHRKPELP